MERSVRDVSESQCYGCGACVQKCPKQCISMAENVRGFLVPVVDAEVCISCGICQKICPERNEPLKHEVQECFIAKAKCEGIQRSSTSGGVFSLIAMEVINSGGTVYGCCWDENLSAHHVRVECIEDLDRLRQSKYVQSNLEETYQEVKNDLSAGKIVLYSGTGCQLAGLKNYVGEHENLILVEIACHGVPSSGLFRAYIEWLETETGKEVKAYVFRNRHKHKKGEHYQLKITFKDGTEEYRFSMLDPYYASFIKGITLRETCYECKFKGSNRVGDILLADFWGCEKVHPDFDGSRGASAVVCITAKGSCVVEGIKSNLAWRESSWDKVTFYNKSLVKSAECFERYQGLDISRLVPQKTIKTLVKIYMPEKLKYWIKRL